MANVDELNYIKLSEDKKFVHIGATTKLEDILRSEIVPNLLRDIIKEIGSPGIRHSATLAGNIANASPAGDSLLALYLFDAKVVLKSIEEERTLLVKDFIIGVRRIDLHSNELIKEIIIPLVPLTNYKWVKVGGRRADSISKVSFAGMYLTNFGLVSDIRMAFGSVAAMVARSISLENSLKNRPIEDIISDLPRILEETDKMISPIDDQRSNKQYRRKVCANIMSMFIKGIK